MSGRGGQRLKFSRWVSRLLVILLLLFIVQSIWVWWSEDKPENERLLRLQVHDQLSAWFPQQMNPDNDGWYGLGPRFQVKGGAQSCVVLVHGLDEPGTIWDDLVPALEGIGVDVWEFHYPNDQGIDRSVEYLAKHWPKLSCPGPVVMIGHSMGGLVVRDFISRLRHPVGQEARVHGAPVAGVILVGTPNQGSQWARMRVLLELRDHLTPVAGRRFSLFSGLRDGLGEAKIDLRPGSVFLRDLNRRPWPESVRVAQIAGLLLPAAPDLSPELAAIRKPWLSKWWDRLEIWWSGVGVGVGDGVVSLDAVQIPGLPSPIVVNSGHRTMLTRIFPGDPQPLAVTEILKILQGWSVPKLSSQPPSSADSVSSGEAAVSAKH